ncbi:hypothetical protein BH18THE2_BH18THE2_39790 [soil metagenome]
MDSGIQLLELAKGIKDSLLNAGFFTIDSILNSSTSEISHKVGVDLYVAQIILQEARRAKESPMARAVHHVIPTVRNVVTTAAAIEKDKLIMQSES